MDLSLKQAAALCGKSERQIRYLIQQGRITAQKKNGRWVIPKENLPSSPGQAKATEARQERLQQVVEDALGLKEGAGPRKRRYSVTDLRAFSGGLALHRDLSAALGTEHELLDTLRLVLVLLAQGCHSYHARDKTVAFATARERACELLTGLLLLDDAAPARKLADRVEQELIASLAGLIRRSERGRR